ncbi:MAG: hypothetical protein FJ405_16870, partial [Verrucomicrobia bacterium]|nr:hypothetical protein [Verrucomicrobiota bacterium]
ALGDQGDDKENYRLGYAIKNRRDRDDFETLIQRLKIFSISDAATFNAAADQMLDVDQWLRAFALAQLCGANDNYSGSGSQHNLHLYVRPSDGKLLHLLWDLDFAFHIDAGGDIYNNSDLAKLTTRPANNRTYLRHLRDIINTTYNTSYMAYWVDHYDNFTPGQNFGEILTYIQNRSATARGRFPRQVPFGITSNGGRTFATNSPIALIAGSAWLDAKNIAAPGAPSLPAFTWTSVTNWRAAVPVILGSNLFTFSAIGDTGEILSNATITVIGTAVSGSPDLDSDGLPDVWETIYDFDVNAPNGDGDVDRDGFSNLDEYLAGTDPRNASSGLSIGAILQTAEGIKIRFNGVTGRSYSIQHRDVLPNGAWKTLGSVPAVLSDQTVEVLDASPGTSQRYYRLVTPSTN